jgi:uncharacterized repeat protein (TIGR03803 family)
MKQMFTKKKPAIIKAFSLAIITMLAFPIMNHAQNVLAGLTSNGGAEGKGTAFTIKTDGTGFNVFKTFADWGRTPNGDLYKNSDGNFYGMTSLGGTYSSGTIFKMTPSGVITIIRHLNSVTDGASPHGELIKAFDGNFYGLTNAGGTNTYGTLFRLTPAGVYTVLKHFNYSTDGANPRGHLVQGKDSSFYGITYKGGMYGYGTIFKMTKTGTFSVLRHLNVTTDGVSSYSSLTEANDGSLYGMTYSGGTYNTGTIFKITKAGVYSIVRSLNTTTDGASPQGDLIKGSDGNFYGSCYTGGSKGNGTIFKLTTSNGTFTVLRHLAAQTDGGNPYGNLFQNTDGVLYGMNRSGGAGTAGTAFKITTSGTFTLLHSFVATTEGSAPNGGFVKGNDGNFYGMTSADGIYTNGTIFRMTSSGTVTVLVSFYGARYGNMPQESLLKGKDSAYYGTTSNGGTYGYGTIFKTCAGITTTLFSFNRTTTGGTPQGSLIQATDGNFYGTTSDGGTGGNGTIFKITPAGTFSVIKNFTAATDGGSPKGSLVQGKDSLLYGTTSTGGTGAGGTIFKIKLSGTYTVLRHLVYATDGSAPEGNLVQGNDGNFYGMTSNNAKIFKVSSAGVFTVIRSFTSADGSYPLGGLVKYTDGNFYGMTSSGGTSSAGTIFKLTTANVFSVIKHLNGTTDGKTPKGNLLVGADGNLYGMTSIGGTYNAGTIFKVTTGGTFTVLRQLNMTTDGGNPYGGLIIAPVNNLVATPQSVTTNEDVKKTITLAGTGGSPLAFNIVANPAKGTISTGTAASRTYTPSLNTNGVDSFAFNVSVGCVASLPVWVKITVAAIADTPVLATIGNKSVKKDSTLTFKATATDGDAGQVITYSLISAPAGAAISSTTGTFTWKPTATGTYTFKVRATDNGSPALYDEEQITVTVTATLAARIMQSDNGLETVSGSASVYPNPAHDNIHLSLSSTSEEATIQVYDMNGRLVISNIHRLAGKKSIAVNIAALQPGTYVVKVQSADTTASIKLIKQ